MYITTDGPRLWTRLKWVKQPDLWAHQPGMSGKTWKFKGSMKVSEGFVFPKRQNIFKILIILKIKCDDFHLKNVVLIISFSKYNFL